MASIKDMLVQQGLTDGSYTIRQGAGNYQVVYDSTGRAVFKISPSMLSSGYNITPYGLF